MCEMYTYPINYTGEESNNNPSLWSTQETIEEDKVILETEITLRAGPNITMKIHEESRPSSVISGACESEEDCQRQGIIKVLHDDSESDFYDEMRKSPRTPRKVRFGGESFKLRTPESDSSQQADENDDDDESSIKITVTDAISIKTRRSLIPVRITSLPSSPKKSTPQQNCNRRLYKSAPNLSSNSSKIPLRRKTMQEVQNSAYLKPNIVESRATSPLPNISHQFPKRESDKSPKETSLKPRILKHRRAEDVLSPVPVHEEIEVFHNLTRSPERNKNLSADQRADEINADNDNRGVLVKSPDPPEEEASKQSGFNNEDVQEVVSEAKTYNSFTVCEENNVSVLPKLEENSVIIEDVTEKEKLDVSPFGKKSILQQSLSSLTSDDEIWAKSEALESVLKMLREPETCESLEAGPAILVFEALLACHHRDRLHSLADDALTSLIQGLRNEVLEQCLPRLAMSICKMGATSGVRCALTIMKKLPPKKLQVEILSRGFGHRTREGALQILMACARLYPRQDVETMKISEFAASALRDRRRRVRHAALETIAATAQLSSVRDTLSIVEATVRDFPDADEIVQVVRTRLSRKQLPSVNLDGSIRYSSPTDQRETDWISRAIIRNNNGSSSPLSSASSSTPSVNYWMHNSRHVDQFSNGTTLIKQVSETYEDDSFDDPAKIWAVHSSTFPRIDKGVNKGPRTNVLRPVYILQPEISSSSENGKNGRGHRKYDRGRSISPSKQYKGQYQSGLVEAVPVIPVHKNGHGHFDDENKNYGTLDVSSRLHYPDHGAFRPHEFRKSFSSDQLYYNDRLPPKHEPYSFSLSSRSSSTSTGSSTRSGFWHRDLRSGIPIPVSETKLKIRHSTSSIVASGGPLIAKRSAVTSPHHTPSSSKTSPRDKPTTIQDNDSISQLSLPPPRSSGSESSGYFTPSPPENHPPAFIKMESEERLCSDIEEPLDNSANNNSRDCADSFSVKSVGDESLQAEVNKEANVSTPSSAVNNNDCLGEVVHDNYSSVESVNISNNNEENIKEPRPPSHTILPPESIPTTIEVRRKSKSVIDLPNFLPKIESKRKCVSSAPPRNEEPLANNNIENNNFETKDKSPSPASNIPLASMDYAVEHQKEIVATSTVTVSKSKLERRFSRKGSRKLLKVSPKVVQEPSTNRPASKPKDILQHVLNQLENPNWEITVEGLQGLAKLARQHPEVIENQMHHVCVLLAKQIKNLRSQVSRVACNTASELFLSCKRGLDMEMEEIACPLLQRTADTNRFLRADANAALGIMCEQMPAHRVIPVLTSRGCGHQNAVVRAAAVRLLGDMVARLGADRIFQMPKELRDKVLMAGANALADGNLDARLQGKLLFKYLIDHPNFQRYLHETVPQSLIRHISKGLLSIK